MVFRFRGPERGVERRAETEACGNREPDRRSHHAAGAPARSGLACPGQPAEKNCPFLSCSGSCQNSHRSLSCCLYACSASGCRDQRSEIRSPRSLTGGAADRCLSRSHSSSVLGGSLYMELPVRRLRFFRRSDSKPSVKPSFLMYSLPTISPLPSYSKIITDSMGRPFSS